jgi:hypothetical protein
VACKRPAACRDDRIAPAEHDRAFYVVQILPTLVAWLGSFPFRECQIAFGLHSRRPEQTRANPAAPAHPRAHGTRRPSSRPWTPRTTGPQRRSRASHPRNIARSRHSVLHATPKASSPSHQSCNDNLLVARVRPPRKSSAVGAARFRCAPGPSARPCGGAIVRLTWQN